MLSNNLIRWLHTYEWIAAVLLLSFVPLGYANSNCVLMGQVKDTSGEKILGAIIKLEHKTKGLQRTTTSNTNGKYDFRNLPVGDYILTISSKGYATTKSSISISVSQPVSVENILTSGAFEEIVVYGTMVDSLNMSEATAGMSFDSDRMVLMPVDNGFEDLVLMTANTVDNAAEKFRETNSIAGGSPAENGYYLNGFDITQIKSGTGSFNLPWEAISQTHVQTGGIEANFGGALGGIVSAASKSGGNQYRFGIEYRLDPMFAYEDSDQINLNTFEHNLDANKISNTEQSEDQFSEASIWASGPIMQDRAFFYALMDTANEHHQAADHTKLYQYKQTSDQWFFNFEWYISADHSLDITSFSSEFNSKDKSFAYEPSSNVIGLNNKDIHYLYKNTFSGLAYQGNLNETLSVNLRYAISREYNHPLHKNLSPRVVDATSQPFVTYSNTSARDVADNKFKRNQLSLNFNLDLERHSIEFGVDQYKTQVFSSLRPQGSFSSGDARNVQDIDSLGYWSYRFLDSADPIDVDTAINTGAPLDTEILSRMARYKYSDSTAESLALYAIDRYQLNDRWTFNLGLRMTNFSNTLSNKQKFIDQKHNIAPRIAAIWDIGGLDEHKLFTAIGRYYQPVSSSINFNLAGTISYYFDHYAITERDEQGRPALTGIDNSPAHGERIGQRYYRQREVKDPKLVASQNLKAMYTDQISFGYNRKFKNDLVAGIRFTYNELKRSIEDTNYAPVLEEALREAGLLADGEPITSIPPGYEDFYILSNPGEDVVITYDFDDADNDAWTEYDQNGDPLPNAEASAIGGATGAETIVLTPAMTRLPKIERKHISWEFTLGGQLNDRFSFNASYTWAHNYGNTEGVVDTANRQIHPTWTTRFDEAYSVDHSYGNLPNDRRHSLKFSSMYQLNDHWIAGAVFRAASGAPKYVLSAHPQGVDTCAPDSPWRNCIFADLSMDYFYDEYGNPAPRGTTGNLPWTKTLDLSISYQTDHILNGLLLKATIYNLFNDNTKTDIYSQTQLANFEQTRNFTTPRFLSLTARLAF